MLVFCSTCDSVDFHYELFCNCAVPTELGGTNQLTARLAEACGLGKGAFGGPKRKPRTAAEKRKGKDGKLKNSKQNAKGQSDRRGMGEEDDLDLSDLDLLVGGSSQVVFKLHGNMAHLPVYLQIGNDDLLHRRIIPAISRGSLVVPDIVASVRIQRHNGRQEEIVTTARTTYF